MTEECNIEKVVAVVEKDDTGNNDENTPIKDERTCCWGLVKRRTLLVIWGTITVTLTNFGYFTGGFYALNYFQTQYFGSYLRILFHFILPKMQSCLNVKISSMCRKMIDIMP